MTQPAIDPQEIERILSKLEPAERLAAEAIIRERAEGKSDTLKELREIVFKEPPPPLDEFIYSKAYLGLPRKVLFPAIEDLVHAIDDPAVRDVWICAGKGSGKSTVTSITMARQAHLLSICMRDPSAYFNLLPGILAAVLNMSISSTQAELVMFNKFLQLIRGSGCFNDVHGEPLFRKRKRHIEMPNNIHALSGHSGFESFFGYDIFCGVLDEFAFFKDKGEKNIAEEVYSGILGSAKTRFPGHYKIVAISTPLAMDGPIMKRIQEAQVGGGTPKVISPDGKIITKEVIAEVDGDSHALIITPKDPPDDEDPS